MIEFPVYLHRIVDRLQEMQDAYDKTVDWVQVPDGRVHGLVHAHEKSAADVKNEQNASDLGRYALPVFTQSGLKA